MNIKQIVFNKIIERAEEVLAADEKQPPPSPDTRTAQQKALDIFFSVPRFCEHHDSAAKLVGILTGYEPVPLNDRVEAVQFRILYCTKNKTPWLVLQDGQGFASFAWGRFHNETGCERRATSKEARAFLEKFKTHDPDAFFGWCEKQLEKTRWMVEL